MATSTRYTNSPRMAATRARQGRFGRHVLWVLLVSLALAVLALFGSWAWQSDELASTEPNNWRARDNAQGLAARDPVAVPNRPTPGPAAPAGPASQ